MKSVARVTIHASQFPENVRRDLLASLHTRKVNHKFHYDSVKQTQKWLALHEAHSPARGDDNCLATYDAACLATAKKIRSKKIHVLGLGCGGGQKDAQLLSFLKVGGRELFYTPCDVSTAMVLVARQAALAIVPDQKCFPFVCDLATADNLQTSLVTRHPSLITFFGMIPNFAPQEILPKLAALLRPQDWLLFSANLAPGKNYAAGVKKILPQYDNALTRDWLLAFLTDLGVEPRTGNLVFTIKDDAANGLKRISADFHFARQCQIKIGSAVFNFRAGENFQLFFSYRYTPEHVRTILSRFGLDVREEWLAKSGEEGVFLCRRKISRKGAKQRFQNLCAFASLREEV
jgi:uncharacterized SAM-dependent methyltransferase